MSPSEELQKAIVEALVADPGVAAIVDGRVIDGRPELDQYPCLTLGPSDYASEDHECITGGVETLQIDAWVRDSSSRLWPTKALCHAVKRALHEADLPMTDHALVQLRVVSWRALTDPDGITGHGVVTVEAQVEEI